MSDELIDFDIPRSRERGANEYYLSLHDPEIYARAGNEEFVPDSVGAIAIRKLIIALPPWKVTSFDMG
jgi:hypothetical protein